MKKCAKKRILSEDGQGRAEGVDEEEDDRCGGRRSNTGNGVCSNRREVHDVARVGGGAGRGSRAGVSFYHATRSGSAQFSSIVRVAGGRVYVRCCERGEGEDEVED